MSKLRKLAFGALLRIRKYAGLKGRGGIYFYAIIVGSFSAFIAAIFQKCTQLILSLLTGTKGGHFVEAFEQIEPWQRIFSLSLGGVISGLILLFASKKMRKKATPYMEAVAIGNGYIPMRSNLLRSLAAIVTIGSGASIGREGPLVQTATVFASWFGRKVNMPLPRLRLFIACAAAGGMSAVFHTPLAGGLFVCEIVIGVMSIDILAPLLIASCSSYVTVITFSDPSPLYEISSAHLTQNASVALFALALGVISSLLAKLWLSALASMRAFLNGNQYWLPFRLMLTGAVVGGISIFYPEIVGNGAHIIRGIVSADFSIEQVFALLCFKIFAVALFFGMGAIGGVLTPSLTIGNMAGFLFAHILIALGVPLTTEEIIGFSLLGMASFFTTAAAAPITSLLLVVEFTLAGKMIFPLTIGVLASYFVSKITHTKSMYAASVSGNVLPAFNKPMGEVKIGNIFRKSLDTVLISDRFSSISKRFLRSSDDVIFVTTKKKKYIGAIFRSDIIQFLKSEYLSEVIAEDIMRTDVPTLSPETCIIDAIKVFYGTRYEALPMVDTSGIFKGTIYKSDIITGFSEVLRRERVSG